MRIPLYLKHNTRLYWGLRLCLLALFSPLSAGINLVQLLSDGDPAIDNLGGVTHAAISPDGRYLYAAARYDNAVGVYAVDPISGLLARVTDYRDGDNDIDGLAGVLVLRISTDGRFLYTGAFEDGAITIFSRDLESGLLTLVDTLTDDTDGVDGLQGTRDLVLSGDDRFLFAIGSLDHTLTVFNRNTTTGALTLRQAYLPEEDDAAHELADFNFPANLICDSGNLYVTTRLGNNLFHFSRVNGGGDLDLVEVHDDVDKMVGPDGLTISPDGRSLYVAADQGASLIHFDRNTTSGKLDLNETISDDNDTIDGLGGATGVTVSEDGNLVYVTSRLDDALVVFDRAADGALTIQNWYSDDQDGFSSLAGAREVLPAMGGQVLYLLARDDDAINVLSTRDLDYEPIEPPLFVRHHHFYRDSDLNLHIRLPDPRSDGLDYADELGYTLTLQQKGRVLWGPLLVLAQAQDSRPQELVIAEADLPTGSFAVGVRRAVNLAHASVETLFPAPVEAVLLPDSGTWNFKRWLLHVPKPSSGFDAVLHIANSDAQRDASITLVAFDEEGLVLATEQLQVAASSVNRVPVYGSSEFALFKDQEEQVSHLAIWEETPQCSVSLACLSQASAFFAVFETRDLNDGKDSGSRFTMPGRRNPEIGEGIAVLNLGGLDTLDLTLKRLDEYSGEVLQTLSLGSIPAGGKRQFVLSGLMSFVPETYYILESDDPNSRFQVMGLAISAADYLSVVPLVKLR